MVKTIHWYEHRAKKESKRKKKKDLEKDFKLMDNAVFGKIMENEIWYHYVKPKYGEKAKYVTWI